MVGTGPSYPRWLVSTLRTSPEYRRAGWPMRSMRQVEQGRRHTGRPPRNSASVAPPLGAAAAPLSACTALRGERTLEVEADGIDGMGVDAVVYHQFQAVATRQ